MAEIGPIDVNQLIGRADPSIVEPRAVAALGDAFHKGFVTVDDIIGRVGELGQAKKKVELQTAQDALSPEARAARAAQLAAGTAQGTLGAAQANAAMQNVDPAAELQAQQIEQQKILMQYPAIAYFQKFAPKAAIETPFLSDGKPDYKQMEKIGSEMAVWASQKEDAQAFIDNTVDHTSLNAQGQEVTTSKTKQGEFVDQKVLAEKRRIATRPFTRPSGAAAFSAPGATTFSGEAGAAISAAQSAQVVPRDAAPAATPVDVMPASPVATSDFTIGTPSAGGYISGAAKQVPVKMEDAVKQQMQLAEAQALGPIIDGAKAAVARGTGVGPIEGMKIVQFGNQLLAGLGVREQTYNDQDTLQQAISKKILEGAQVMKGNLSDKDVRFLQATVPSLTSSESVWNTYLDRWAAMNRANIAILTGKQPRDLSKDQFAPPGWVDPAEAAAATPTRGAAMSASAPARVKTAADVAALPVTVQFFLTPDGRTKKNPNYRP